MRLTNEIRKNVADAMCRRAFQERLSAVEADLGEAFEALYVACMGGKKQLSAANAAAAKVEELLGSKELSKFRLFDALRESQYVDFNIGGERRSWNFPDKRLCVCRFDVSALSDEGEVVTVLLNLQSDILKEQRQFRAEVMGVLESVTTSNKLADIWPEAVEFLPGAKQAVVTDIAPTIKKLSALLTA